MIMLANWLRYRTYNGFGIVYNTMNIKFQLNSHPVSIDMVKTITFALGVEENYRDNLQHKVFSWICLKLIIFVKMT